MIFFIIMWGFTALSIVGAIYFQNSILTKPNKNVLIGVTIPFLQLNNERVIEIINSFKKSNKKLTFYSIIGFIPSFFTKYVSIQLIYLFIWIAIVFYFSNRMYRIHNKKLMNLKRENNWMLPSKRVITIDTELTRIKDKMPVSFLWFIPSILLSIVPIVIELLKKDCLESSLILISLNGLFGTIIFMIVYRVYVKKKSEVISEDSKVNLACNKVYIRTWTAGTIVAALIHSISMILVFLLLNDIVNQEWLFILVISLTMLIILIGIFYINEKIRKEQNDIISRCNSLILIDNDEYWSTGFYINPNDRSVMVPDRAGYGMTYNLGNKKGKFTFWGMLLFALIIVIPLIISSFRLDFGTVSLSTTNDKVIINSPQYGTSFNVSDIEEVTMVDDIPSGVRTNAAGTPTYNIGNFSINGYGKSKLYVYFECTKAVCIKLKDKSYIFINSRSLDETENYYKKLLNLINN